jgi:hypothetical protein
MMRFSLENKAAWPRMKRAEKLLAQRPGSNHSDPDKEDRAMADCSPYGESTPVIKTNQELPPTWQPIGALVEADVARIMAKRGDGK